MRRFTESNVEDTALRDALPPKLLSGVPIIKHLLR